MKNQLFTTKRSKRRSAVTLHRLFMVIPWVLLGATTKHIAKQTGFTEQQVRYLRKRLKKILK